MVRKDTSILSNVLAQRRAEGIAWKPLGRPLPQRYPIRFERQYNSLLQQNVREWQREVVDGLLPLLPGWVEEQEAITGVRADAWPDDAERVVDGLSLGFNPEVVDMTIDYGTQTADWHDTQWRRSLKSMMGVDIYKAEPWLVPLLSSWAKENDRLQKKMSDDTRSEIRRIVNTGIQAGKRHETIRKEILNGTDLKSGVFKKTKTRAALIARDQIGKLNATITENRQTQLGIENYFWRTALDERVRGNPTGFYSSAIPSHWDREGKRYSWKNPPSGGHPGQAIQCRCISEPDMGDVESEVVDRPDRPAIPAPTTTFRRISLPLPVPGTLKKVRNRKKPPGVTSALSTQEGLRRAEDIEYVSAFDKRGNRLFENRGGRSSAPIKATDWGAMRGKRAIMTHNHPRSTSFSVADINCMFHGHCSQMRIGSRKADYSFRSAKTNSESIMNSDRYKIIKKTTSGNVRMSKELRTIYNSVEREMYTNVRRSGMTVEMADMETMHRVWDRAINKNELNLKGKYTYRRKSL